MKRKLLVVLFSILAIFCTIGLSGCNEENSKNSVSISGISIAGKFEIENTSTVAINNQWWFLTRGYIEFYKNGTYHLYWYLVNENAYYYDYNEYGKYLATEDNDIYTIKYWDPVEGETSALFMSYDGFTVKDGKRTYYMSGENVLGEFEGMLARVRYFTEVEYYSGVESIPYCNVEGEKVQYVLKGADADAISVNVTDGFEFVEWNDGNKNSSRKDNCIKENIDFTAKVKQIANVYTIIYEVQKRDNPNDTDSVCVIEGNTVQYVREGKHSQAVNVKCEPQYFFTGWDDGNTSAMRSDLAVRNVTYKAKYDVKVTIEYDGKSILVFPFDDKGGKILGEVHQSGVRGYTFSVVTAVANEGYKFVKWSDGITSASRQDTFDDALTRGVIYSVYPIFEEKKDLIYKVHSSGGGYIEGTVKQSLFEGDYGTEVTAVADYGYVFMRWLNDDTVNATRRDVMGNQSEEIVALFKEAYEVSYEASVGGKIDGAKRQKIEKEFGYGELVTAIADEGYEFLGWSDGVSSNTRREVASIAGLQSNLDVVARFCKKGTNKVEYTVNYIVNGGGYLTGEKTQIIEEGKSANSVTVTPYDDYMFIGWSDGRTEQTRVDVNIKNNINVNAVFRLKSQTPYKVEYYLQNLEDDNYTLYETAELKGMLSSAVQAEIKAYEHFTPRQTNITGVIKGDGSTILKVYYIRNTYTVKISSDKGITLDKTYQGTYKYGYEITEVIATFNHFLGDEWQGWYMDEKLITKSFVLPSFIVDKDANYIAKGIKEEMLNFEFTNTSTTCTITGLKNKNITEIIIPDYITSIGDYAFYYCYSLTSVTIGNSVENIGKSAFYHCSSLTSVTIGNSVTSIGDSAFSGCRSLTSVTIGNSVTSIGNGAFELCSIEYAKIPALAISYIPKNNLKTVEITSGDSIKNNAFNNCSKLTSVTIGNSVTSIGDDAFYYCYSLTSVTIGNSVTSIGDYAFYCCSSLTSVTIPDSVTSIGDSAFYNCSKLTSITIPDSVTSIGDYAFEACSRLQYNEYGNGLYLGNKDNPYLVLVKAKSQDITTCEINSNTRFIHKGAFYWCSSLTSVTIPALAISYIPKNDLKTVEITSGDSIKNNAFQDCSSLTSVTIGNSVTSIGDYAFSGCSSLTSVTIGNSVTSIGDYAFYCCSSLTSVTIPDSVTSIGDYAFSGCSSLTSVTIGNSVENIGKSAFYHCSSLTSVTIGNSVTSIGDSAFSGCSRLQYNEYDNGLYLGNKDNPYLVLVKAKSKNITTCEINSNTKLIYEFAFEYCSSLTSITIPDSVTSIGDSAFYNCSSLTSMTIGSSVTSIGNYAFHGCSSLQYNEYDNGLYLGNKDNPYVVLVKAKSENITTCEINSNTKLIYKGAFYWCSSLTSVTIGNSVTSIGDRAFNNCSSLTSVTIGNGVTSIGDYAFGNCSSLTSVTIGNSVTSIGNYAFAWCSSLQYNEYDNGLYLGNKDNPYLVLVRAKSKDITTCEININTKFIYDEAFQDCNSLTDITFNGTKEQWQAISKDDWKPGVPSNCIIHCSDGDIGI